MPKSIRSTALITILVEVKNDDGSAFTYSQMGTAKWTAGLIRERREALREAVNNQAEKFLDLEPIGTTND